MKNSYETEKQSTETIVSKVNLEKIRYIKIIGIVLLIVILLIAYNYYEEIKYARQAQEAIRLLWLEEQNYFNEHRKYVKLEKLIHKLNPDVRAYWKFQLFNRKNPRQIRATSTKQMPDGVNHIIIYDIINDTWSGYGS